MTKFVLNRVELRFLRRLESANKDEMLSWKLPNLYYPIVAICLSLVCYLIFKDSNTITTLAFTNLLLNGSIPMVALNRLSTLGINIFRFDKTKEKQKSNADTYNLRVKIHYY